MRSKALLIMLVTLFCAATRAAQEGRTVPQLVVPLESAGYVAFKTETVAPETEQSSSSDLDLQSVVKPQVLVDEKHVVHRIFVDNEGVLIFGYDLVIEPLVNTRQFKISVRPLDPEFEKRMRARQSPGAGRNLGLGMNAPTLPRPTEAQVIDDGDGFALDLLINPQTGVKIVDVVKASFDQSRLWEGPKQPARDFTLDSVELAVRDFKLFINGQRVAGGRPTQGPNGALIWFYVPDRGRFIFSLTPREGYDFQKIGHIEDNKISFTLNGDYYEWTSSAPVVGSGGSWNLWVLRDTRYTPSVFYVPGEKAESNATMEAPTIQMTALEGPLATKLDMDRDRNQRPPRMSEKNVMAMRSKASGEKIPLPRARVEVGAADRIENLWPK